jgi:PAS domain S-box-containing protein
MLDQVHMTSLFENATEGIILTNGSGVIVVANPAVENMFGYANEELVDQPIEILIPEKFKGTHHQHREGFYNKPSNRTMGHGRDLYGRRKDGSELPVEISLSHYKIAGETFVIAFIVDITERKRIENRMLQQKAELEMITEKMRQLNAELEIKVEERTLILKEALQKLEQSQEELSEALDKERQLNEIKSRFVSMASHEFRTPLTTVLSSASLLSKYTSGDDQEKREKHIQRIKSSVNNLNDILEDFLSLGKLNEGKVEIVSEQVNFSELIADTLDEMKAITKNGQCFKLECSGDFEGFTDKKLFRNIIINLISNAIKFSDEGTEIKIRGSLLRGVASISVIDQGIGISKNDKEHLFASFFRAANATNIQGTGLGLHIVKRSGALLGGKITVESELYKGTTGIVMIPI